MPRQFPYDDALKLTAMEDPASFLEALKRLLHMPPDLLTLVGVPVSGELQAERRFADLVWRVGSKSGKDRLLQVEFQLFPEEPGKMEDRLLEYAVRLYLRDHLPVDSVVIFLRATTRVPTPPLVWAGEDQEEFLRFQFRVVRLWEEPHEAVLSLPAPVLWPLAGAMAGINEEALANAAEQIVAADVDDQQKQTLLDRLGLLAGLQLEAAQIDAAFGRHPMVKDLWKESSVTRTAFAEGREEGRTEEARRMAQLVLEQRFGPLGADLVAALNQASETTLEGLVVESSALTPEQVRVRLGLG